MSLKTSNSFNKIASIPRVAMPTSNILGSGDFSVTDELAYVTNGFCLLDKLVSIADRIKNKTPDEDPLMEGLEILEDLMELGSIDVNQITYYGKGLMGPTPSLRKRPLEFKTAYDIIITMVDKQSISYLPFSAEEETILLNYLYTAISNLACLMLYSTGLSDFRTMRIEKAGIPATMTNSLSVWATNNKMDLNTLAGYADKVFDIIKIYKSNLGVFEEFPDLLPLVEEVVDDVFFDCDKIDRALVLKLLEGKLTKEEFIDIVENGGE